MVANLPQLRSPEQIAGGLIRGFQSRLPFPVDLNTGSVVAQLLESVKQTNFKSQAAVIQMVNALSTDRATGDALIRLANDNKVPIFPAIPSSGQVSITDLTFQKIASQIYAGQPAPVSGSITIFVADASNWPAAGVVYIGRGTTNFEGPLQYTSVTSQANGSYWQVNLAGVTPTTRFHNIGETVVVGQGGIRTINSGAVVQTQQGSSISAVQFTTTSAAVIPDGEVTVDEVPVIASTPGPVGNVPAGAIVQALGIGFQAAVNNPKPFSNGRDADTPDQIRERIKAYSQAKSLGTATAIELYSQNVVAPDELKRVTSATVVDYADSSSALVFDDGTGYEPLFSGIGIEQVVDQAIGGEREVQLRNKPVAQARIECNLDGPYNIPDEYALSCTVAGVTTVHFFKSSDFRVPAAGTPIEVASSINGDPNLNFLADTAAGQTRVVVYPRDPNASDITVNVLSDSDAGPIIGFPNQQAFTLRLYKNNEPLYEQGLFATVSTRPQPTWSSAIQDGDTLIYSVDGTPDITATFTLAAFQAVNLGSSVSSLTDLTIWAQVVASVMPGVTAAVNGELLELTSNRGLSDGARLEVKGGTLFDKIFVPGSTVLAQGRASDYTFNRNTAQIGLVVPLQPNDQLSAGSAVTQASTTTVAIPAGPAVEGRAWFVVDGESQPIPSELQSTSQVRFSTTAASRVITIEGRSGNTFLPEGFGKVQPGDWMLVWANVGDDANLIANQLMLRVQTVEVGLITLSGDVQGATSSTPWFSVSVDRIVFVRSDAPMQRLEFDPSDINTFATTVTNEIVGVNATIVGSTVRISTKTIGPDGDLLVAAADVGGKSLGLTLGTLITNVPSGRGSAVTVDSEAGFPNFTIGQVPAIVNDQQFLDPDYENLGGDEEDFFEILEQANTTDFVSVPESDRNRRVLVTNFDVVPDRVDLLTPPYMLSGDSGVNPSFDAEHPTIQAGNRYFLRAPFQFDSEDALSVVVDGNEQTESYNAPVARRLLVNTHSTPSFQDFSADDAESSLPLSDPGAFFGFNFANFRAWRRAAQVLTDGTYSLNMRSSDFGPAGDRLRVGFVYPSDPTQTSLSLKVGQSDVLDFGIVIPATTVRTPNWDASTSFTTSVVTSGGLDAITYTWRIGTQPNFISAGVTVGDVAILAFTLGFLPANAGYSAKVSAVGTTSFTVELPTGKVVADAVQWDSAITTNRVITLTYAGGHGIVAGQQFGLYNTQPTTGSTRPYDSGTYVALSATNTTVTAQVPAAVPGGPIASGVHSANVITITSPNHGLFAGNIVKITGAGASYDGIFSVSAVLNANQFQYVKSGSSAPTASGVFDFQTIGATLTVANITAISRANNTNVVTATTSAPHGFNAGDLVSIQSVNVNDWAAGTYNFGDVVEDPLNTQLYKNILAGASATNPSLDPVRWAPTTLDLSGTFPIASAPTATTFTYLYNDSTGATVGTTATATLLESQAFLARSIAGSASRLAFAEVGTTAQEVIDFLDTQQNAQVTAELAGGAGSDPIAVSTEDLGIGGNYLSGSVVQIDVVKGSRIATLTVDTNVPAGSTITIDTGANAYDGTYVVLTNEQDSPNWLLTVATAVQAPATATVGSSSGTFVGSTPYLMLADGDGAILSSNVSSPALTPQFVLKRAWSTPPAVGEEVRLVTITADQLTRFWNRLVVTGLSNVAEIENSLYGRNIQITTDTFGSIGSIQVAGGSANAKTVALQGSGSMGVNRLGSFTIPYDLRKGINAGQWIRVQNSIQENKQVGFSATTFLQLFTNGMAINTSENFVVKRATTQTSTTLLKVERHGQFVAILNVGGSSMGLSTAGVQEGDWVRIKNVFPQLYDGSTAYVVGNKVRDGVGNRYVAIANSTGQPLNNTSFWSPYTDWSSVTSYATGQYASFNGRLWVAAAANLNAEPDQNPESWHPLEFDAANNGIFRVVRTFGEDAFWIEAPNVVEEVTKINDPSDLSFYTYDSVMPGDELIISGPVLGIGNAGRYTVLDESPDGSTLFPAPKFVYTDPIPQSTVSTLLGLLYSQVNFLEKEPVEVVKRVFAIGQGVGGLATVLVDTPALMDRMSSSNQAFLTAQGKLNFPTIVNFGLDGYKYYQGLIEQLNLVIYGDPTDPILYPGVRAAGTNVDIKPALIRRIQTGLAIRTRIGVSFANIINQVQASVAGYVNQLGVGEQVSLSSIVAAAQSVNGVTSVVVTFPTYNAGNDQIAVGADEKAYVVNPSSDIVVAILGT